MPINAGLINALVRPVRSVQDYQDDYARQDIQQQGLQRNALMMQEAQAAMTDRADVRAQAAAQRNALNSVYGSMPAGHSPADLEAALIRNPLTAGRGHDIQKDRVANEKIAADTAKLKQDRGIQGDHQARLLLQSAQSPTMAADMVRSAVDRGLWTKDRAMSVLDGMPIDLTQWDTWRNRQLAPAMAAKDILPTSQVRNTGGSTDMLSTDVFSGVPSVVGSVRNTQSPDNKASVGASYANAAAVREAAKTQADAVRAAANTKRDQDTEMKLADDYRAQSKEFLQSKSAFEQLNSTLASATTSPAATLAAATKFMKILDPGSVVRESELGMALAASGVLDRAMNYVSTLQSGKKLTATQAADFKDISGKMFVAAQGVQKTIDADYQSKAKAYNLRPEMVTQDLGQNAKTVNWGDLK